MKIMKNHDLRDLVSVVWSSTKVCLMIPPALIARHFLPSVWLISERPDQARDNGYVFFKYLNELQPKEQKFYYIIDKKSSDYNKINQYDSHILQEGSLKHYYLYCVSRVHISAHRRGCRPDHARICELLKPALGIKDVFIPHGVNVQIAEFCFKKYSAIDLYISCSPFERKNMIDNHGYNLEEVPLTGFPRQDGWWDYKVDKKLIIMMPTWRVYLSHEHCDDFTSTDYFRAYQTLINDREFDEFLVSNDIKFVFYPHNEMRKFVKNFTTECSNIEIAYDDSKYDIQDLLKRGALLITDYSSLYFDFAYMSKPVVYYQFDQQEFREKQYAECGFDVEKFGFGPVCKDIRAVVSAVKQSYGTGFEVAEEYHDNMLNFFAFHDKNNCRRVFDTIKEFENCMRQ